jgi:hypothetical protein
MTRSADKHSSNKEAVRRGEARPRILEIPPQCRPAPTQKPKERPALKGAGSHGQDAKLALPAGDRMSARIIAGGTTQG